MSRLISVDGGIGVQIPPQIISAGHLGNADLSFEVTSHGVHIKPKKQESQLLNAITEKTLQDADQGRHLVSYSDAESF